MKRHMRNHATSRRAFLKTSLLATGGFWVATSAGLAKKISANEKLNLGVVGTINRANANLNGVRDGNIGHHKEWIAACKGGAPALCDFSYAGPLAETVLLGNVAFRSGRKLEWDSAAWKVTNTREADPFIRRPYRRGWKL